MLIWVYWEQNNLQCICYVFEWAFKIEAWTLLLNILFYFKRFCYFFYFLEWSRFKLKFFVWFIIVLFYSLNTVVIFLNNREMSEFNKLFCLSFKVTVIFIWSYGFPALFSSGNLLSPEISKYCIFVSPKRFVQKRLYFSQLIQEITNLVLSYSVF